ncbi:Diguanylate cyclase [Frankia sp. Hr75.2]|nr:Diguanylate cyclase [Frankia sp. Hr75.2]
MSGLRGGVAAVSRAWRSTGAGRTPPLLSWAVVGCLVLLGLDVAVVVLLDPRPAAAAVTSTAAAFLAATAVSCLWTARRARGAERRWRLLIGLATAGAVAPSLGTAKTLLAGGSVAGRFSPAQAGFFVLYGVALLGLLSLPSEPIDGPGESASTVRRRGHRWYAITVLDSILIVGSIALLEWGTVLATVVQVGAPDLMQFLFALVQPVTSMILAAAVLLIASFRRPRSLATSALLGAGLLISTVTGNGFLYLAAAGNRAAPPGAYLGFALSWLLTFLAALVPVPARVQPDVPAQPGPRAIWAHAVLPYMTLCAAGLLVFGKLSTGAQLDRVETYGMVCLLLVVLVRQMVTLAENGQLLAEVRERERQLHYQAFYDPLTGLANRALFIRRLQRALSRDADNGGRGDGAAPVSLLFLDLDDFKQVNDTFGHATGDELLKISAERLRAGTRALDTVARLGGDEFAVILDGGGPDDPRRIGERLATAVQAPCQVAGRPYTPRASLGLVTLDGSTARPASPDILLHQADLAMYAAKRERAGRLVVYRPDL